MRRKVRLLALLASVFAIGACENLPELPQDGINDFSDIPLNINAVPAGDFTRATDTAFETGDAISVFGYKGDLTSAFSWQSWLTNGKFTKGANGFTSAETHYWYSGEDMGHIIGIYPYNENYTAEKFLSEGVSFYVKSDQSTHANYTASDLMYAVANNVAPTAEAVTLEFNHVLSKLVVDIDNQSAATIKDVYVSGVYGGFNYTLVGGATLGNSGAIKAGKLAEASQGYTDSYTLIIPPQQEIPNIAITTTTNKQYTFSINEPIEFNSGKVRHLKVTITEDSVSTEIDATIRDWYADEDVEFSDANNPGGEEPLPDYMMMEENPNWELTVIENYYDEGSDHTYPAVVELIATDDMAYNYVFYYKDYWESLTEEQRLMELTNYAAVKSAILVESITTYKQDGIDVTAKDLFYYGSAMRTINFSDGEYIACIVGFNDDGTIAYKYACSNYFTYVNPVTEEYLAWCGAWEITDGTNTNPIEISQREPGRNYWVEGWEGIYGVPFVLDYNASGNYVRFGCQQVATNVQVGDSIVDEICMWGLTNFGNYQNSVYVVDGYMQDENTAVVESKMYYDPENPEYFIDFFYVLINDGNPYYGTNSATHITFPATMTRVASAEPAAKHQLPVVQEFPAKRDIIPTGFGYWGEFQF